MATSDNGLATILYAANETTAKVGAEGRSVNTETDLTLIPMGVARLRISAFPKVVSAE